MIERDKAWAEYCEASADLAGIQHRATPDQWQTIENYAKLGIVLNSCIVELRDRIAALEEPPQPEPTIWSAINALADRLAALEAAANLQQQDEDADRACPHIVTSDEGTSYCELAESNAKATSNQRQVRSSAEGAPSGGLVERVAHTIHDAPAGYGYENEAYAAILAVAEWLGDRDGFMNAGCIAAHWLREEVERG
jgi:hypothetical protein